MKEFTLGPKLGDNVIKDTLGVGSTAKVVSAYNTRLDEEVALKVYHPDHPKEAFDRELSIHTDLQDTQPHVVPLLDSQREDGSYRYLVLGKANGGTAIEAVNTHGPMGIEKGVEVLLKLAVPLDALQDEGKQHGDVKTATILFSESPATEVHDVWASDFGATRPVNMDGERSSTSIGTVTYASPEQVSGKVSPTSDQFGAAASLVEVSFGEKLIPIPVAQRYRKQVLSRAFGEYLTFRTNLVVPEPYRSPIRRAMDPDHENRFSSVGAFVQDVAHRHADVVSEGKKPVTIIDLAPKK